MQVSKGTKCILSKTGHYNIFYMSDEVSYFNQDCVVTTKSYLNTQSREYIAVQTENKNVGSVEQNASTIPIIVWVKNT
jgi:hypothetical protein